MPSFLVGKIQEWKNSKLPVHFLITGTPINIFCNIDDFTYYEQGGDVGTLYFSITLKEYRDIQIRKVKVSGGKASVPDTAPTRTDNRVQEKTHTVVAGDSLWAIAQRHLGDGSRYNEIASLNSDIIKSPNLIHPGQVLKLPT